MVEVSQITMQTIDQYGIPMVARVEGKLEGQIGDQERQKARLQPFTGFVEDDVLELTPDNKQIRVLTILVATGSGFAPHAGQKIAVYDREFTIRKVTNQDYLGQGVLKTLEATT